MSSLIETLTALHEEVRQFIEQHFPEYKVVRIDSDGRSSYQETMKSVQDRFPDPHTIPAEYIMSLGELSFRVRAENKVIGDFDMMECRVDVQYDGKFHLREQNLKRITPRF